MLRTLTATIVLAGLLLGACAGAPGTSDPPATGSPDGRIAHPSGGALVLRVEQRGGFVAPAADFTRLPEFTLLGDGRVVQPGAVAAIFPGPLMPPLNVRRLSESGIQAVLREVASTRLFHASRQFDGARARVADAPDTLFELHADQADVTISVYALGIAVDDSGLPADETQARRQLANLEARLTALESWLPPSAWADAHSTTFIPSAVRLLVRDATAEGADPSGIGFNFAVWPTDTDPAAGKPAGEWRCLVAAGAEAEAWNAQLAHANSLTRWTRGERRFVVMPLPLLPDLPPTC